MAERDRARGPNDDDAPASVGPEDDTTASAYAPPARQQGFWRNPSMVGVLVVVGVALVVFVILLG